MLGRLTSAATAITDVAEPHLFGVLWMLSRVIFLQHTSEWPVELMEIAGPHTQSFWFGQYVSYLLSLEQIAANLVASNHSCVIWQFCGSEVWWQYSSSAPSAQSHSAEVPALTGLHSSPPPPRKSLLIQVAGRFRSLQRYHWGPRCFAVSQWSFAPAAPLGYFPCLLCAPVQQARPSHTWNLSGFPFCPFSLTAARKCCLLFRTHCD